MHSNQLVVTPTLASALIGSQFPDWAALPVEPVPGPGTVNAIFRVGRGLAARFPVQPGDPDISRRAIEAEAVAAAEFATVAEYPAPMPVGIGAPGLDYPMPWLVQTWIPGRIASARAGENGDALALDIAALVQRLRMAPARGRIFSGQGRGGELGTHDAWVQRCILESEGLIDARRARDLWSWFRKLPNARSVVMSHTDLTPANLLVHDGRLVGVLDAGGFAPADPALDLVVAWHLFDAGPRQLLRTALRSSETEWMRGAAWAFQQAMGLVWYYEKSNPSMSELGRSTLDRIFSASFE